MQRQRAVIKLDPDIQSRSPCFAGTRVPMKSLFDYLTRGRSLDYFLEQFPSVKRRQATAILERAGKLISRAPRAA
ncbi:MAG: DUF433 domain-containing protein [Tepidisphaeraceae bacterium]